MGRPSVKTIRAALLVSGMTLIGCLGGEASAQVPPATQPGVQQQTIEQEQRPTRPDLTPRPPAEIDKPAPPDAPAAARGGPRVSVRKFRITGNTAIATDRLEALVRPDEGQELTLEQLRAVAAKVTEYYGDQGYILARAYLPPQDVREGILEIAVLEGEIGAIEVIGYEYYSPEALLLPMTRFRNARIVHEGLLETAINELNDYPGLNVRASLKPGEKRGLTDVVLTAQERFRLSGKLDADNYGSRFSGVMRYGGEFTYGGFTGYGDKFTFRGLGSDETLSYFRGLYETPVGGYGTHLRFYYSYSENMVGDEFAALNAWSWFQVAGAEISQTILRTSGFNLSAFAGFDYKRVENDIQGDSAGKDDLRIFRLGFSGDYRDRLLGRTYFGMTWFQEVPGLGGNFRNDPGATRPDNPGAFSKWTLDVARLQSLVYGGSYLVLRGFAQVASQNMVAAEQYSIGGYYTVRGYPLSERSGDQGYSVSAELVVPVPYLREWLQAAAFVDHGGVFPISPDRAAGVREHFLSGVGAGLRLNLPAPYLPGGTFQLRLDYGYAVGPRPTSTTNRLLPATDRGILYVSTAIRF